MKPGDWFVVGLIVLAFSLGVLVGKLSSIEERIEQKIERLELPTPKSPPTDDNLIHKQKFNIKKET